MARPLRVEFEDAIYHVCTRGNARQRTFLDNRDRSRFVELLAEWRDALMSPFFALC